MKPTYNRRESWENEHGGAPVKCVLDVSRNLRYFFNMTMSVNGLTGIQSRLIGYIYKEEEKGNAVFQRDIEDVLRIKRSSVTSLLQTMEKKGLLIRESVQGDARIKKLILTETARELQLCSCKALEGMEHEIRNLFSEEEFYSFLDYMNRIDRKAIELYNSKEEKND